MKERFATIWTKVSRIGLNDDEGISDQREVVFLNRILSLIPPIFLIYIPLEIYLNGYSMIHIVLVMVTLFISPLILNHYRYFRLARAIIFITALSLLTLAGLMVGRGVNNHVSLIPIILIAVILFKKRSERIIAFLITTGAYLLQNYLFSVMVPSVYISPEIKQMFSHIFFIMAMVITYFAGVYFININREYEGIVNAQKEALSIKNAEVTASITYARRIQNAILPSNALINELLPDSFVFYRPKDIVAGDFYRIEKVNDKILIAAADSTGHGVPGAMVSVVCNNALSRSVREFKLEKPSLILDKAREIIISEFEKSEEDVKDGMDISLCVLSLSTLILNWAGANNPLIIIRGNELIELKPDKQPVGKFSGAKPFENHEVQLQTNDVLYLFSDGFSDQFGGPNGKKFKYKAFKQLLLAIHSLPLERQKYELDKALNEWRSGLEQVDDICVIGIRV